MSVRQRHQKMAVRDKRIEKKRHRIHQVSQSPVFQKTSKFESLDQKRQRSHGSQEDVEFLLSDPDVAEHSSRHMRRPRGRRSLIEGCDVATIQKMMMRIQTLKVQGDRSSSSAERTRSFLSSSVDL